MKVKPMNSTAKNKPGNNSSILDPIVDLFIAVIDVLIKYFIKLIELIIDRSVEKLGMTRNLKAITDKDFRVKVPKKIPTDCLGYSKTSKKFLRFSDIDTRRHNLLVGASGFGKTNLLNGLMENDLRNGRPFVAFDPKGSTETINFLKNMACYYGRDCYVFSEHYATSKKFNPLKGLGATEAVNLIMRSFSWENEYYKAESKSALIHTIASILKNGEEVSLKNVLAKLIERGESTKTLDKIRGLTANLECIVMSSFGRAFGGDDGLSLKEIRESGACLYIGLSTAGFGDTAKQIGKIFLNSILYHSYEVARDFSNSKLAIESPISIYFDELGSIIVPDFIDLLNKCRSSGIQITSAVQSLADIDEVSTRLTRQVWENCNNIFIQKQSSPQDVEMEVKSIGTYLSSKKTHVILDGEMIDDGSVRETREYLCHPDDIKKLKIGECILLRHAPKTVDLVQIKNMEEEQKRFNRQVENGP